MVVRLSTRLRMLLSARRQLTGLVGHDSLGLRQDERFAMPWNEADREQYAVIRERYASDLSDEEYDLIRPLLPDPQPLGCKPTDNRTILNVLFYMVRLRVRTHSLQVEEDGGGKTNCGEERMGAAVVSHRVPRHL